MKGKQSERLIQPIILFIFIVLGIVAENNTLHLIFGVHFTFTAVFYLMVLRLFGYRRALLAAMMIHIACYFMDSFGGIRFIFTLLEISFVAVLLRWKGKDLLWWDLLFWCIGWPIVCYISLHNQLNGFELAWPILLHGIVNALISAMIAQVCSGFIPRLPIIRRFFKRSRRVFFGKIITYVILTSAVLPMFCFIVYSAHDMERSMMEQLKSDMEMTSKRVEEKLNGMDEREILSLKSGSIVQKAYIKEMFDHITGQNDLQIYVVNLKHEIFLASGTDEHTEGAFTLFDGGYVAEVDEDLSIWLPEKSNSFMDWSKGYYYNVTPFLNFHVYSLVPIEGLLLYHSEIITHYYQALLLLMIVAVGFALLCKWILTRSLSHLTKMTANLPKRMEQEQQFDGGASEVHEFHVLSRNFETAAHTLKQMFQAAKMQNRLLTEQTKELMDSKGKLEYLAHYDELTGLLNRRTLQENMEELLLNSKQRHTEFATIYIDIDQFKQINDTYGHRAGDELLTIFAQRLRAFMNKTNQMKAYRFGGDEFILTLENAGLEQTQRWCDRLMDELRKPVSLLGRQYSISISMGVSIYPGAGDSVEDLMNRADSAMYQVKKSGRNGIQFFENEDDVQ